MLLVIEQQLKLLSMAKLELYKDNELVLSVDGKVDNDLLVFGNIVYDMINDTLIREDVFAVELCSDSLRVCGDDGLG